MGASLIAHHYLALTMNNPNYSTPCLVDVCCCICMHLLINWYSLINIYILLSPGIAQLLTGTPSSTIEAVKNKQIF